MPAQELSLESPWMHCNKAIPKCGIVGNCQQLMGMRRGQCKSTESTYLVVAGDKFHDSQQQDFLCELPRTCHRLNEAIKCLLGQTTLNGLYLFPDLVQNSPVMHVNPGGHTLLLLGGIVLPDVHPIQQTTADVEVMPGPLPLHIVRVASERVRPLSAFFNALPVTYLHNWHQCPFNKDSPFFVLNWTFIHGEKVRKMSHDISLHVSFSSSISA